VISLLGWIVGGFGEKWPQTRQIKEKLLLGGHFLTPNCVFWAIVCEIISIRLACAGALEKKAGRKKSQEVYISRMFGATSSGWIPTKLGKGVPLTDVIKRAKFHRYNLRGVGAVRCWSYDVAIGNPGRPLHSAWRSRYSDVRVLQSWSMVTIVMHTVMSECCIVRC